MWRRFVGLALLLLSLLVLGALSLVLGSRITGPGEVLDALVDPGRAAIDTVAVVRHHRIPRTALAVVVGMALGMAGALTQGHTRNPLADPGLLGITAGAAFAVVIGVAAFDATDVSGQMWFALLGAGLGAVAVFGIAAVGGGGSHPLALVLAGVALSAFLTAMTTALVLMDRARLDHMRMWSAGSLAGRDTHVLTTVAPLLAAGAVLALVSTPALNALGIGVDAATALGVNVRLARAGGLLAVMLLAGAATAAVGPVGFVGLVAPHLARMVTGPDHRWVVPYAALMGAVLLLSADIVGRVVARPGEIQVDVVVAFIGAPFFIALVRRRRLVAA